MRRRALSKQPPATQHHLPLPTMLAINKSDRLPDSPQLCFGSRVQQFCQERQLDYVFTSACDWTSEGDLTNPDAIFKVIAKRCLEVEMIVSSG